MRITSLLGAAAVAWTLSGCGQSSSSGPSTEPSRYAIEPSIDDGPANLADAGLGPIPVAAVADDHGTVSRFVANEVLLKGGPTELAAFQQRHSATVLSSTPISIPQLETTLYRIRVDASGASLNDLPSTLSKAGLGGLTTFSSTQGAQIAALVLGEMAQGTSGVALNFVSEGHLLTSTSEEADANGVADAFSWPEFDSHAWQFLQASGFARRVKVAVIDGGFWLNAYGAPCDLGTTPSSTSCNSSTGAPPRALGVTDLPSIAFQFDTITGGSSAGGVNPNNCSAGSACPWHGNRTASVILGTLNNGAGAAGMGGQVADPILLKTDGTDGSLVAGIVDALGAGADIINLSLGGDCDSLCRLGHSLGVVDDVMDQALDGGVLVVASAGNNNQDALDRHVWPCQYSSDAGNGVYCVGALSWIDSGGNVEGGGYLGSRTFRKASFSNYGSTVNIWAPTHIRAMPDGDSAGSLTIHGGTSASAPFVSGVAAMCKAVNPGLDARGIKDAIGSTAFVDNDPLGQPDPLVGLIIQPYDAVVACGGGYQLAPELHITAPDPGATIVADQNGVLISAAADDVADGVWPLSQGYKSGGPTQITFTSDVDGPLSNSSDTTAVLDALTAPEGLRHVTATVTNGHGKTTTATVAFTTLHPHVQPTPVIVWPAAGSTVSSGTQTVIGYAKSMVPGVLGNIDCGHLVWNGSVASTPTPGDASTCQAQLDFTPGQFQVSLAATDGLGDVGVTTETVDVVVPVQLTPIILSPQAGATVVILNGAGTIALQATGAPVQAGGSVAFGWSWYYTSAGVGTAQLILDPFGTGDGSTLSWNVTNTGICSPNDNGIVRDVSVRVSAFEFPGDFTGDAHVDFQVLCSPLR